MRAERAIELNPAHPSWYWSALAIHNLRLGRAKEALRHARMDTDGGAAAAYIPAAAERLNGRPDKADAILRKLAQQTPGLDRPGNDYVRRNRVPDDVATQIFAR